MSFPVGIKKTETKSSLQRRLIKMTAVLLLVLSFLIVGGLFMFRQISMPGKDITEALQLQEAFFTNSMESYFNSLTAMTVHLGEETSYLIEYNVQQNAGEDAVRKDISSLEEQLIPILKQNLLQADCSGGFILFNTGSTGPVPGIYIKKDIHHVSEPGLFLYRGIASLAEDNGLSLHSKWHTNMNTSEIPGYDDLLASAKTRLLEEDIHLSTMTTSMGTDDQVVYLTCPLKGTDGTIYGLCGFEISERYFRAMNVQPTRLSRLICVLLDDKTEQLNSDQILHCGYHYVKPEGILMMNTDLDQLIQIHSADSQQNYVGIRENLDLPYANEDLSALVMIPKVDYDDAVKASIQQMIILFILVAVSATGCCWFFSRLYLKPIRLSLRNMSTSNYADARVDIHELDDLSDLLAEKSSRHKDTVRALSREKQDAEKEVSRLAYDRKKEIDPQDYILFKEGLNTLTSAERQILNLIGDGHSTREILDELYISENTLKFHIKNIYSKLNVHSRRQASMYLSVYRKEQEGK